MPILLHATCNGFQHLAILSQESKLYAELNLTTPVPNDFYTFLLGKLTQYFIYKIKQGVHTAGN